MQLNTHIIDSTAFEANEAQVKDRTNEEQTQRSISFDELLSQNNVHETMSYQTKVEEEGKIITSFTDPTNGKMVSVALDKQNIERLQSQFGQDDVFQRSDGSVLLDNKAEAFVAGWFSDIAYNRKFLSADENNDGLINENEYKKTHNNFEVMLRVGVEKSQEELNVDVSEKVSQTYLSSEAREGYVGLYRGSDIPTSLDDELNMTLKIDKDFDSKVSLEEAYSTDENKSVEEILMHHVQSLSIEDVVRNKDNKEKQENEESQTDKMKSLYAQFNDMLSFILGFLLNEDDNEMQQLMSKLNEASGDESVLNSVEKDIMKNVFKMEPSEEGKYSMEQLEKFEEVLKNYELNQNEKESVQTQTPLSQQKAEA
jgi:hypothetical protein